MSEANEPAFPHKSTLADIMDADDEFYQDLTKREYFAGLAMQGMLAGGMSAEGRSILAIGAVDYADALLEELGRRDE